MAWISITFFYITFWFISLHISKIFCSILSLSRKVHWPKTCVTLLLHSLLPLAKRIEGLTAWVLLCLPSPLSKNSVGIGSNFLFYWILLIFSKYEYRYNSNLCLIERVFSISIIYIYIEYITLLEYNRTLKCRSILYLFIFELN